MATWRHSGDITGHGVGNTAIYGVRIGPNNNSTGHIERAGHVNGPSNCHEDPWGQNIKTLEQLGHSVDNQWNNNLYSTTYGYKTGVKGLKWGRRGV